MNKETNDGRTIDKTWTLFLDRDGVINKEIVGTYVTTTAEFEFCEGATEAIQTATELFGRIIIVTNQRGVGRGIMTTGHLREIHNEMEAVIASAGGRIDRIYACTAVSDDDHNRKPNPGMAMQAREDFPEIDFKKSIMVGNSISDMEFGKRLGMHTVFVTTKIAAVALPHDLIDEQYPTLAAWASHLAAHLMLEV